MSAQPCKQYKHHATTAVLKVSVAKKAKTAVTDSNFDISTRGLLTKAIKKARSTAPTCGGLIPIDFTCVFGDFDEIERLHPYERFEFDGKSLFIVVTNPVHEAGCKSSSHEFRDSYLAMPGQTDADIVDMCRTTLKIAGQAHEFDGSFRPRARTVGAGLPPCSPGAVAPMPSIGVLSRDYQSVEDLTNVLVWALTNATGINGMIVVQIYRNGAKIPTTRITLEYYNRTGGPLVPVQILEIGKVDAMLTAIPLASICQRAGTHILHVPVADFFTPLPVPDALAGLTIDIDGFRVKDKVYLDLQWTLP